MNYWLVKFAPFRCSWQDVLRAGKFEIYSIRNAQARNNLAKMRYGDMVLFYHSQIDKCIMGSMRVITEAHQDATTADNRWLSVTFEPEVSFAKPIPLQVIKSKQELLEIGLIRQPRLSAMPLSKDQYQFIMNLDSR